MPWKLFINVQDLQNKERSSFARLQKHCCWAERVDWQYVWKRHCNCFLWTQWNHVKNALVWAASSMWQLCHNSPETACTVCKGHVMQDCQFVQFLFHVQIVILYQPNAVHSAMTPVILSLILTLCSPRQVDSTTASKLFQKTSVTEFSSVSSSSAPASEVRTF